MHEFIANSDRCDICAGLDGKHFDVEDMMPGENAPPMHPNCRCSVAAYEDSEEYEAWLDHLANGGSTASWNSVQNRKNVVAHLEKSGIGGIIKTPQIGLQFFANSSIPTWTEKQLAKAARNWERRIVEHKDKLIHPEQYYPSWDDMTEEHRIGALKHWEHEIQVFEANIKQVEEELKKRKG